MAQSMLKKLPVWPVIALAPVRGDAHAREVLRRLDIAEQVEHQRRGAVLAVVVVRVDPRVVVAVGHAPLADVEADQPGALRSIASSSFGLVHARLAGQDERDRQRQTRGVHHAVAGQPPVVLHKPVPPRTDFALPAHDLHGDALQVRHDAAVARGEHVLGEQDVDRPVPPRMQAPLFEIGVFLCLLDLSLDRR
jgi:hypothetical protein